MIPRAANSRVGTAHHSSNGGPCPPYGMRAMITEPTQSINEFLAALAAKQPTPGGGSVAAIAGALAAAMGEMVINYSIGKKNLIAHEPKLREALAELTRARGMLLELMIEDQLAFEKLTAARKACNNAGDSDPTFAAAL